MSGLSLFLLGPPRLERATDYVSFDVSPPPFNNTRVRRAFVLATDRETMADVILSYLQFSRGSSQNRYGKRYDINVGNFCLFSKTIDNN